MNFIMNHSKNTTKIRLDLDGALDSLPSLLHAGVGLGTHDATSPVTRGLLVVGLEVAVVDSRDKLGELVLVLGADLGESEDGSGLLVDDRSETGLALDDDVGDTHLAAEGGEVDDELDGVDVVGDEDEAGLLVLDETDNVVQTELGGVGLLADILLLLALGDGGGLLGETLLLLGLGLRAVLVEELESLSGHYNTISIVSTTSVHVDVQLRSATCWNWAIAGGTFKRMLRIFFWRWRRTYAGHRTMRETLRWGWMSWPIPKFLGRFSMRGFWRCQLLRACWDGEDTHLGSLLATTSLALGEGGRRRFLSFRRHLYLLSRLS